VRVVLADGQASSKYAFKNVKVWCICNCKYAMSFLGFNAAEDVGKSNGGRRCASK
jgi:hypothetical protein